MEDTSQYVFDDLSTDEQMEARKDSNKRYLSYIFLKKGGNQYKKLKVDLKNEFTTGDDRYLKNIQGTIILLDK